MKIKDIPDDFILITDSQDVKPIIEYLGIDDKFHGVDSFFVRIENGDYTDVYGFSGIVPNLDKTVVPFKQTWLSTPKDNK